MKHVKKQVVVTSRVATLRRTHRQQHILLAVFTGLLIALWVHMSEASVAPLHSSYVAHSTPSVVLTNYISPSRRQAVLAFEKGQHAEAADMLRPLAYAGDAESQYYMGVMHDNGAGVEFDVPMAVRWYRMAAEQGHADAQYNLGIAYSRGEGVHQDMLTAIYWWQKAGMQGNLDAQFNLGVAYSTGRGIERDYVQAIHWWHKAARLGDSIAQYNLGAIYAHGVGVNIDMEKALGFWRQAAAQGNKQALAALKALADQANNQASK